MKDKPQPTLLNDELAVVPMPGYGIKVFAYFTDDDGTIKQEWFGSWLILDDKSQHALLDVLVDELAK